MDLHTSTRTSVVGRTPEQVWDVVAGAGPGSHWYADTAPFVLRGRLDTLLGGEGRTGVPDHPHLCSGDRAGLWRVLHAEQHDTGGVLQLEATVRAPGRVRCLTRVEADERGYDLATRLTQAVSFAPAGLLGTVYLLADLPAREVLLELVHRRTVREARGLP